MYNRVVIEFLLPTIIESLNHHADDFYNIHTEFMLSHQKKLLAFHDFCLGGGGGGERCVCERALLTIILCIPMSFFKIQNIVIF